MKKSDTEAGGILRALLYCIAALAMLFTILWFIFRDDERFSVALNFFERGSPEIAVTKMPPGVGTSPAAVELSVRDDGTGLDEVVVRTEQEGDLREVLRKRYPSAKLADRISVPLDGKTLGLSEGDFILNVRAFDRAFWSNGRETSFDLKVDYGKPRLEITSPQHNAVVGGSELLFYRLLDRDIVESGVVASGREFHGFSAKLLDAAFETATDLYFAFFAIPLDYDDAKDTVTAFARDEVGNMSTASFYYKAAKIRRPLRTREISREYLSAKLKAALGQFAAEMKTEIPRRGAGLKEDLRLVSVEYTVHTDRRITRLLQSAPIPEKLWSGPFLRPVTAAVRADYGEGRMIFADGEEIGTVVQRGVSFSAPVGSAVMAAGRGTVVHAGELGPYGTAVLVDHGLGLSSLYAHLAEASVKKGVTVAQGEIVGRSGESGFVDGPSFHFEMRVDGYPVRPVEWWDKHWVRDHIEQKISDTKRMLGVGVGAGE